MQRLKDWLVEVPARGDREINTDNGRKVAGKCPKEDGITGTALLGSDGLFSYLDEPFAKLFGYEREDLLGKTGNPSTRGGPFGN